MAGMRTNDYDAWDARIQEYTVLEALNSPAAQYTEWMGTEETDEHIIDTLNVSDLTPMQEVELEFGNAVLDQFTRGYRNAFTRKAYRKKVNFSSEMFETNRFRQFLNYMENYNRLIPRSRDLVAAGVLRNAFAANKLYGDGKPLASIAHPLANGSGTYANTFTDGLQRALDYNTTKQAEDVLQSQVSDSGNLLEFGAKGRKMVLWCTPNLRIQAFKVADVDSEDQPDTADRNANYFVKGANYDVLVLSNLRYEAAKLAGETAGITKGSSSDFYSTMWGLFDIDIVKQNIVMNISDAHVNGKFDTDINRENESIIKYIYDKYVVSVADPRGTFISKGNNSVVTL